MPTPTMATWQIAYRPDAAPEVSEEIRAAYACGEDRLPGWTILKDAQHQIVKMLRDDVVAAITRVDEPRDPWPVACPGSPRCRERSAHMHTSDGGIHPVTAT